MIVLFSCKFAWSSFYWPGAKFNSSVL